MSTKKKKERAARGENKNNIGEALKALGNEASYADVDNWLKTNNKHTISAQQFYVIRNKILSPTDTTKRRRASKNGSAFGTQLTEMLNAGRQMVEVFGNKESVKSFIDSL